jgi:hypothetical protein
MMKLGLVLSSPFDSPQQPPKAFSRLDSVVVGVLSFFLHFFLVLVLYASVGSNTPQVRAG